jgi:hypothetical protein|tara:strand:- start:44 stop:391 length:348 start_codon:yes stop_codon:yes gene_type:complete
MTLNSYYQNVKTDGWKHEAITELSKFCFPMMAVDMDQITEDTIPEILIRLILLERIGTSIFSEKIVVKELYDLLKSYIGLTTNVGRKTRHQFLSRHTKGMSRDVENAVGKFFDNK